LVLHLGDGDGKLTAAGVFELFSTCPQSKDLPADEYRRRVADVAAWSDRAGYRGILVYTDNQLVDPWLVAQIVIESTEQLCPLVAVQPVYMHPYTAANMVSSFAHIYGRQIFLNMVAGGFRKDLLALGDKTEHAERYARVVEYALLVKRLLEGERVTFTGRYYTVENLSLTPALPTDLFPGIFVSGSSDSGVAAARAIGATAVKYPKPPNEEISISADGQIAHALAMKVSDSQWHRQLSELGAEPLSAENPYWLGPFENYKTFCPYLVGSYTTVAIELARYIELGFETFILDIPPNEEELQHAALAFEQASRRTLA
jgi:alkanesulfonate monooxygenase